MNMTSVKKPISSRLLTPCVSVVLALASSLPSYAFELFEEDSAGNINQQNVGVYKSNRFDDNDIHSLSKVITKNITLSPFTNLKIEIPLTVSFEKAGNARAELIGPEKVLDKILFVENGQRLAVRSTGFQSKQPITLKLYGKDLSRVFINSAADVDLSGIDVQDFLLSVRGSGDVIARGQPRACKIDIKGAADLDLSKLQCQNITLTSLGAADATVYASKSITGMVQGAGDLQVLGSPAERTLRARGAYDVEYD